MRPRLSVPHAFPPAQTQALLETHFDGGGYFPRGGSSTLARAAVSVINRNGSAVFVRARVDSIIVEGGVARGVLCKGERLECSRGVVSNAGAANTYERLLHEDIGAPCVAALRDPAPAAEGTEAEASTSPLGCDPSVALAYVFVGLDASDADLELPACNYWCLTPGGASHWDHDAAMARVAADKNWGDSPPAAVFLSFGSSKDDSYSERRPGTATLQLLAPVNAKWFETWEGTKLDHRGADYEALKAKIADYLLENYLYKHFPKTRGRVVKAEVATPLTTDHYLNTLRGENYGLAHSVERFSIGAQMKSLHTETDVKNLTMVGQDTFSVGICAALMSGYLTVGYLSKAALLRSLLAFVFA